MAVFRAVYSPALLCTIVSLGLRRVRENRSLSVWHVVTVLLLLARALSPWLDLLSVLSSELFQARLFAYDGGWGTFAWIAVHAAGYVAAGRIYMLGCRGRGLLLAVTWTLAVLTLLCNGRSGGDEIFSRWRT